MEKNKQNMPKQTSEDSEIELQKARIERMNIKLKNIQNLIEARTHARKNSHFS